MSEPQPSDATLVERAQRGDRPALDTLLRRHTEKIHALCRRIVGPSDADDAAQEALIAVVRGLARFDGRSAFGTWAYRVATNACLDELRRRQRRPLPTEEVLLDAGKASEAGIGTAAERLDVEAALARIAPDFRAAVVLRDLCGLDYAEISEVLGIAPGTVKSRIARGRAALVPLLSGSPGEPAGSPGEPTGSPGEPTGNPAARADRPTP